MVSNCEAEKNYVDYRNYNYFSMTFSVSKFQWLSFLENKL